jgi:rubrerythrin
MVRYRRFGEVALELGILDPAELAEALAEQAERRARGEKVLLGQILLEKALIDESGIKRVLDTLYPVEKGDAEDA